MIKTLPICIALWGVAAAVHAASSTLVYLPLDERYATRGMFLNLVRATPFEVVTPSASLLCQWKRPADPARLLAWLEQSGANASIAIISVEMALYGGLINSRISNDTEAVILQRLAALDSTLRRVAPGALVLYTSVVMRIPAYNGDFEEPWYWARWGRNLFEYSYYTDQAQRTGIYGVCVAETFGRATPFFTHIYVCMHWCVFNVRVIHILSHRQLYRPRAR